MESYAPVKTEYRGTVYRSKSEAVFARCLDVAEFDFAYETDPNDECHNWDFRIYPEMCGHCGSPSLSRRDKFYTEGLIHSHRAGGMLIEYKPSRPTQTYVNNLVEKCRATVKKIWGDNPRVDATSSYIVWGNPWDGVQMHDGYGWRETSYTSYPIFSTHGKHGWGCFEPMADVGIECFSTYHQFSEVFKPISEDMIQEAKNYRFDLA